MHCHEVALALCATLSERGREIARTAKPVATGLRTLLRCRFVRPTGVPMIGFISISFRGGPGRSASNACPGPFFSRGDFLAPYVRPSGQASRRSGRETQAEQLGEELLRHIEHTGRGPLSLLAVVLRIAIIPGSTRARAAAVANAGLATTDERVMNSPSPAVARSPVENTCMGWRNSTNLNATAVRSPFICGEPIERRARRRSCFTTGASSRGTGAWSRR